MRTVCVAAALGLVLASGASADPFSDLTKHGSDACFRRVYDGAHLRRIPRQQVTSMTLWIKGGPPGSTRSGNVGLALTRRGDQQPLFLSGDCGWGNFKSPPEWMPSFKKRSGAGCVTLAVPDVFPNVSSAEEGGAIILDPAPNGSIMLVHLDDSQVMVKRARRGDAIPVKLGSEDRVFRLARTDLPSCDLVKEAVTAMEPETPAR
jgi:hypothetical protein